MRMSKPITALLATLTLALSLSAQAEQRFVTIGTGGVTGVYYPTGGAICRLVNKNRKEHGIRCSVESTGGSVYNLNTLRQGELDMGVAQSDWQFHAWHGSSRFEAQGPDQDLRAVFSVHAEPFTLVVRRDAGIKGFTDLKGKRVNIGNPGSGQRQNAIDALENAGIDVREDLKAEGVKAAEAPGLLQDGRIDAFFYTVGHPSGAIKEATSGRRKVRLIPITDIQGLTSKHPYYVKTIIPIKLYPSASNKEDIETFGVKATFVTSSKVSEDVVYAITKEVFDHFEVFKTLHPAYEILNKENMLEGMSAPIHPGAIRYYREAGLM